MRADSPPTSRFLRAFCGALLLAVAGNALSLPGRRFVGRYDFGYAIRGDRLARPAQVFDDGGGKLYFEARPNQPMPAVFAGKDLALLVLQPEGQYFTAHSRETEFTLVLGQARARVRRGGALPAEVEAPAADDAMALAESVDAAPVDAAPALHEQPVVFPPGHARLRPEVLEALSALVVRIGRDAPVIAVGRDDAGGPGDLATRRAQALRDALLARGVSADRLHVLAAEPSADPARPKASSLRWGAQRAAASPELAAFDIQPADRDIAGSLRRWARASGYELAWDTGWAAPVNGALRIEAPSFLAAVDQVVQGLRAQGYPVQARATLDRVVRFTAVE